MVNAAYVAIKSKFKDIQITKKLTKDPYEKAFGDGWGIIVRY
jgi:hypothetical protein